MFGRMEASVAGHVLAVLGVAAATFLLHRWWEPLSPALISPYLIVIALTALLGGLGPGLLATVLSAISSTWLVVSRGGEESVAFSDVLRAVSFVVVALLTIALNNARKRAELAIRERDARLQLVSEQIPAGLWSTDGDLNVTSAFGAGLTISGVLGESLWDHFQTRDPDCTPIRTHLSALQGRPGRYEQTVEGRTYEAHVEPLRNAEGAIIGVIGVNIDITQRKRAEEGLKGAKEKAEAATDAKDHFLALLSHELRTPLTPVLAAASALEMQSDLPADVVSDVRMMRRNIELEATLIDDLLDLTRISRGKLQLHMKEIDAHAVLNNAIEICREDIQTKNMHLDVRLDAKQSRVRADPARLQQVFWNLVKNAVKFSASGTRIEVESQDVIDAAGRIRITVRDQGMGIDPAVLPKIFNAFEQGNKTITREFGGLGLGLAISKTLIGEHGGNLSAESAGPGHGASFHVELPTLAPSPAPTASVSGGPGAGAASEGREASHAARSLRILLVEDHADTLRMMQRLLSRSGHDVCTASSVEEAIAQSDRHELDLVISDLGLPDGSGLDVVRHISAARPIKSIALSGFGTESDVARSLEAGFSEHLTKPIHFQSLEQAIGRLASAEPAITA